MNSLRSTSKFADLVPQLRRQFPALERVQGQQPVIYLDGPAGSQVPESVIEAISDYYRYHNANRSGQFATSQETDVLMADAHAAGAAWFGAQDPDEIIFGANMTSLTFQFSRAHARSWQAGDTVVVTQLDHDANVSPWRLAARDVGAHLRVVDVHRGDATLDLSDYEKALRSRPKLVAVTAASNSVGSRTPIAELISMAHAVGAEVYVDAVHLAPHALLDVMGWQADYVVCSAYKFFGPHVGLLWGRRERLESLEAYKVRPASDAIPGKWMTGTQNHAAICGVTAAIDYLCHMGTMLSVDTAGEQRQVAPSIVQRRALLQSAMTAIEIYERSLVEQLLSGLKQLRKVSVFGITDPSQLEHRVPTVAMTVEGVPSEIVARRLGEQGIYCWHGHYYAIGICEALGQSEHGMVRLGLMHTNTPDEIDRLLRGLASFE